MNMDRIWENGVEHFIAKSGNHSDSENFISKKEHFSVEWTEKKSKKKISSYSTLQFILSVVVDPSSVFELCPGFNFTHRLSRKYCLANATA